MAQIVVDSNVMRDKAQTIQEASEKIETLYAEMLQEVNSFAGRMKGTTIEAARNQFAGMENVFETFKTDMKSYGDFLVQAAERYEAAESEGTQKAQEQGKVF